jgi:hypothetical protein
MRSVIISYRRILKVIRNTNLIPFKKWLSQWFQNYSRCPNNWIFSRKCRARNTTQMKFFQPPQYRKASEAFTPLCTVPILFPATQCNCGTPAYRREDDDFDDFGDDLRLYPQASTSQSSIRTLRLLAAQIQIGRNKVNGQLDIETN